MAKTAEYITDKDVYDPESEEFVTLEVWRDPASGKLFAVEGGFVEKNARPDSPAEMSSPYHINQIIHLGAL